MSNKFIIDKLAHKYAFNIKNIRKSADEKVVDFKNINKNFYDEIERNNKIIKKDVKLLKKIKDNSIKELIFTNKDIPLTWRQSLNYEDDLLNTISKDMNLLSYLGSSSSRLKESDSSESKFPKISTRYSDSKIYQKKKYEDSKKERKSNVEMTDKNNSALLSCSLNKGIANIYSYKKKKKILTEREIHNLLEEYKINYPIKEKLDELCTRLNYYDSNKKKSETITNNINESNIIINDQHSIIAKTNNLIERKLQNLQRYLQQKKLIIKQKSFRQNIFNNFNTSKENSLNSFIKDNNNKENNMNKKTKYNKLLDNNNTKKKYKILNPIIEKNVESINYYGPYFAYCPYCRDKNVEFYNNMEPNQCIHLIQHIKQLRKNKVINNLKRSASVPQKIIENKRLESQNTDELSENIEREKLDFFE